MGSTVVSHNNEASKPLRLTFLDSTSAHFCPSCSEGYIRMMEILNQPSTLPIQHHIYLFGYNIISTFPFLQNKMMFQNEKLDDNIVLEFAISSIFLCFNITYPVLEVFPCSVFEKLLFLLPMSAKTFLSTFELTEMCSKISEIRFSKY